MAWTHIHIHTHKPGLTPLQSVTVTYDGAGVNPLRQLTGTCQETHAGAAAKVLETRFEALIEPLAQVTKTQLINDANRTIPADIIRKADGVVNRTPHRAQRTET